jgi:hypothetical protein
MVAGEEGERRDGHCTKQLSHLAVKQQSDCAPLALPRLRDWTPSVSFCVTLHDWYLMANVIIDKSVGMSGVFGL